MTLVKYRPYSSVIAVVHPAWPEGLLLVGRPAKDPVPLRVRSSSFCNLKGKVHVSSANASV
jgi:hypothetical protein